ncbi:MAG: hypothetical protein LC768_11385 [Acidobacteria bacterium]|nr:hypothetical protein [Acidobacteriota bacterium]
MLIIKSVGKVELPELNDEWSQSLGEDFTSVEDLREKLRADLETVSKTDADNRVRSELIAKLIENHEFEVPNALIETQARNLLNNFAQDLAGRGVDLNKVEKDFVQMAYNQMRTQAENDVRGAMLLERVAELENVEISDAEVAEEIERMAQYYRVTPEEIRNSLAQQGGEANISNSLRTRKAVEALVNNAKIIEGEWIDENQTETRTEENNSKESSASKSDEKVKEKKPKVAKKKVESKETTKKAAKKE